MDNKFSSSTMTEYLYSKLPQVYRDEDNGELLKRFMQVMSEGGFTPLLNSTTNIMNLLDVDKCPTKFLPLLCSLYGYEYSLEIPELFQRRLLKLIVEMYKRKGTKSVVKFIARELTGFESEIIENKDFDADHIKITKWNKSFENYRNFILRLTAPYENSILYNKEEIVVKVVDDFLPTNSKFIVIVSYWFKDDVDMTNTFKDSVKELVHDYNMEVYMNATKETNSLSLSDKFSEQGAWFGAEDSYLNSPYGGLLYTNAYLLLRDTVKFNLEVYDQIIQAQENESTDLVRLQLENLFYQITSTQEESRYDIMRITENDNSDFSNQMNSNILLNDTINERGLYTNGIVSWAKIREKNKPDRVVLL